jgi:hypothetical protein
MYEAPANNADYSNGLTNFLDGLHRFSLGGRDLFAPCWSSLTVDAIRLLSFFLFFTLLAERRDDSDVKGLTLC